MTYNSTAVLGPYNDSRFDFSPTLSDFTFNSGMQDDIYSGYSGVFKSFHENPDNTAGFEFSVFESALSNLAGDYQYQFTSSDRGVFESRDIEGILINSGIFNTGTSVADSAVLLNDIGFEEDAIPYSLSSREIVFTDGSDNVINFYNDNTVNIDTDYGISYNILGTISNKVVINVNATDIDNASYSKHWYVYTPDEGKLYMGDDILNYLNNGSFSGGVEYSAQSREFTPQ